ncbi:hypothetical protein OMAG_000610 [Candidatus Omnitrophus magneticus]|uniref:Protein CR006 P-loop domain-containing protein n=1 Tax=Candidatus Omnitrophus magneticus TaxID=1609969 RepID=A0A0F0CVD7_9BACT|nr:hypothetical protein OMAG_000610 [Candidatus Omnitrophus magneticus]
MKIDRIEKIKDHLLFKDFKWSAPLENFKQFNLLYGWNGSGKTTLSNLFQCIEKRCPAAEGEFVISVGGKDVPSTSFSAEQSLPQVKVFNRNFIEQNVFTETKSVTPILFFGDDSVEKQKKIEQLKKELETKTAEHTAKSDQKRALEKTADQFSIEQAKSIKELLSSSGSNSYNNYDKASYKAKAEELAILSDVSGKVLSEDAKVALKKQKESTARPEVPLLSITLPDTADLTSKVNAILRKTVQSEIIQTLKDDSELSGWVKDGLSLHQKSKSKLCLFCGQTMPEDRLKSLEGHFNDEFNRFNAEIDALIGAIAAHESRLSGFAFHDKANLYDHLIPEYEKEAKEAKENISTIEHFLGKLKTSLQGKKSSPFQAASPVAEKDPSITGVLSSVNEVIAKHNSETHNFQDAITQARLKLEETLVAESLPEFTSQNMAVSTITAEISTLQAKIESIESEMKEIEKLIIEHRRPADELNSDLEKYLGRAELKFEVKDAGYIITRQGVLASGLSEGEKTAIAFLYFLKSLSDKNFNRSTGIVVIDDPISSLDSNSLYCAFGFMKERVKDVGQLFVLTHNFAFFRQVKNWFHHLNRKKTKLAEFYMVTSDFSDGSRHSTIQPLDKLLHEYDSEYHYLFKIVHSYAGATTSGANLEAYYHLPNIARRLLETFISFKHPKKASGGFYGMFQEITFDEAKKSRIVRFLHTHSHDGQIDGLEHDNSILSETPQVLADVLTMIQTIDKQHYDELISLSPTNAGQDSE